MRAITRKEFVDENLEFTETVGSHDGDITKVRYVVIANDGEVYDGVLNEDHSFDDGFTNWQNVEVCERFGRFGENAEPIANKYMSRWYSESLYFDDVTGE